MKIFALAVLVVGLGIAGAEDEKQAEAELARYCEMVDLHTKTNGQFGWPAYRMGVDCD